MNTLWVIVMITLNGGVVIGKPTSSHTQCQKGLEIIKNIDKKEKALNSAGCYEFKMNDDGLDFTIVLKPDNL